MVGKAGEGKFDRFLSVLRVCAESVVVLESSVGEWAIWMIVRCAGTCSLIG